MSNRLLEGGEINDYQVTHRFTTPSLKRFPVRGQIRIYNFWDDVFPQFPLKRLAGESRIQRPH